MSTYRGARLSDDLIEQYRQRSLHQDGPGTICEFPAFTSTSRSRTKAEQFCNVLFIIDIRERHGHHVCVSYFLTGSEQDHAAIRNMVVNPIKLDDYQKYSGNPTYDNISGSDYVKKTKLHQLTTWATEVEIIAASGILGTSIFIYQADQHKWLKFKSLKCQSTAGSYPYLRRNAAKNHFNLVVDLGWLLNRTCVIQSVS
ncbi:unnamed protein product [Didymodactylos carnosus]|uniref:Uncharacterized protein n=1 Tax=Didymodactylos carnosus TaxID=1234261 RepID=A0A814Z0D3_9BILA|nr:unnamed protein product [Didymodactylos carnosus]CAF1286815.1 unnamed protein product [Didymodactylos carnosus]CAF3999655.1 unnamed protein product [Didymodactylos carnosus]CAF4091769.1 unnamed protein product [Didymodactylos carnosus]